MRNIKQIFALFFVFLFFSTKIAGLHVLTHHSDDVDVQHCELCDVTSTVNFTPLFSSEFQAEDQIVYFYSESKAIFNAPADICYSEDFESYRFTRPPPRIV